MQQRELVRRSPSARAVSSHDDGEDHRGGADDRGADQHRLGRGFEGVAGAVVLFQQMLGALEVDVEAEVASSVRPRCPGCRSISDSS